jgi:hypothetical protein
MMLSLAYWPIYGQDSVVVFYDDYECSPTIDTVDGLPVHSLVEKLPEFPGGDEARVKFLSQNIRYPKLESNPFIQTTVYTTFIIDTTGNITNVCVVRPLFPDKFTDFEKESMRLCSIMPQWIPGEQQGKKVPVRFIMPIKVEPNYYKQVHQ